MVYSSEVAPRAALRLRPRKMAHTVDGDPQLYDWLAKYKMEKHFETLKAQEVDLEILFDLTEQELFEIGMPLGVVKKVRKYAARDRQRIEEDALAAAGTPRKGTPRGMAAAEDDVDSDGMTGLDGITDGDVEENLDEEVRQTHRSRALAFACDCFRAA